MPIRSIRPLLLTTTLVAVAAATVAVTGQTAKKNAAPAAPSAAARTITLPPLPALGYAPARPVDVANAAYRFVGEHPEVARFVPCYCGCESVGHSGNEACFVKRRDAAGNVLEWDMHGFGCAVCIDVARESMQLFNSGADPVSIRAAIERKWTPKFQTKTPTPQPPRKH
jgi:hypothetical protein